MQKHQTLKKSQKNAPVYINGLSLKKPAVLVDLDEYEGMKETIEIVVHDPNIFKKIKKAEKEFNRGKTISLNKLKNELKLQR